MPILLALLAFSAQAFALSGQDLMTGKPIELAPKKNGTVAVFLSARCPCSNSHLEIVKKLATDFPNFQFVGVHSNSDETREEAKTYFESAKVQFPILQDEKNKLANQFKASRTPHAFVISTDNKTVFKGGVTDSSDGPSAKVQYLRDALTAIQANQPVKISEARTLGCAIAR